MKQGGCWIFLSHSSKDILRVRQIRNEFEKMGHNPLAFHLLCLSDNTEQGKQELDNLIKREIDAREWFVFCDSREAQQSTYVQEERAYVQKSGKQMIWRLDMNQNIEDILQQVRKICQRIEVFISYSAKDRNFTNRLVEQLTAKDYAVWTPEDLVADEWYGAQIANAINKCSQKGFFVVVITQNSANFHHVEMELDLAKRNGATIVPIILGEVTLTPIVDLYLCATQKFVLPQNPTDEDIAKVINQMDEVVKDSTQNI